jgi:NAD(P)-dependent dehydrogenase (short-subunit alcohol dehydrogenase family)
MPQTQTTRSVLITGCSSGIGLATAHVLKTRGWNVIASARKTEDVERLRQMGLQTVRLNVADPVSIEDALNETLTLTGGKLDALVNNAGIAIPGAAEDLSREILQRQFDTNFFGTLELTNSVLALMRRQGYGRIVMLSSILGRLAVPWRGAYNASKFALEGITDTLRLELRGTNIYVSIIEPGPIESRFRANTYAAFQRNIDREHSAHREYYARVEKRLGGTKPLPFTLPPEAVLKKVVHALEARRPKARYGVTFPTHLFHVLRRVLPARVLDVILAATTHGGRR